MSLSNRAGTGPNDWLVECVPNFSEGRRLEVVEAIERAVVAVPGVALLDRHVDAVHNRGVLTFAGPAGAVAEAAFASVRVATELVDLEQHEGVHPRMGAADVVPFVPLGETPMRVCVELAQRVGRRIAAELDVPVYLYGEAATRPERRRLPDVRRGGYETLRAEVGVDSDRAPDFGPARLGKAGATAVGARPFLVAYNVTLATSDLALAGSIARTIRESDGGYAGVQAKAFATDDPRIVQVSMNLLDTRATPLHVVFDRVCAEASAAGVEVLASELVGLAPTEVLAATAAHYLRLPALSADSTIETRLLRHSASTTLPT